MKNDEYSLPGERLDDLQNHGLRILQKPGGFRFGMDAVLLAHFTRLRAHDRVADLGTGTAVLPLLMSQTEQTATFYAFEWQAEIADMAQRSVQLNGLTQRIRVFADDLRNAPVVLGHESMDGIVCNPPYGKKGSVMLNPMEERLRARQETDCTLPELLRASAAILRNQGRLWMVFPAPRALELMVQLRENRLEPKRLRMVCAKVSKAPYLLLVEAVKNAKPMLTWLPPLIVYREDGSQTDELKAIYGKADSH